MTEQPPLPEVPKCLLPPGDQIRIDLSLCRRLTESASLREQLLTLLGSITDLSTATGAEISIDIEPNGDACNSGIALTLTAIRDLCIAELNPYWEVDRDEAREKIRDRLTSAGWVVGRRFHEPEPVDLCAESGTDLESTVLDDDEVVTPRLVMSSSLGDRERFVDQIIEVAVNLMGARPSRWFLSFASANARYSELLLKKANMLRHRSDHWPVVIAELLPREWTEQAVWPRGSESAHILCMIGEHELHEPPCRDGRVLTIGSDVATKSPQRLLKLCGVSPDEDFLDDVRLSGAQSLELQLQTLLHRLSDLSLEIDGSIEVYSSPTGRSQTDDCFVWLAIFGDLWAAEVSPGPKIHGGKIPVDVIEEMTTTGWVIPSQGITHDQVYDALPMGFGNSQFEIPHPRLTCDRRDDDTFDFISNVVRTANRSAHAPLDRWYLSQPRVDGRRSPRLRALAALLGRESREWRIDLMELLPEGWSGPAVWPSQSPRGLNVCIAGLHHLHEPPCLDEIGDGDWYNEGEDGRR